MNEYFLGQTVIHFREGLATIVSETNLSGSDFFVIQPKSDLTTSIYVSKNNNDGVIRPIMSAEEAKAIIAFVKTIEAAFTTNTKQRRDLYKKKLTSGDPHDLAFLCGQLFLFYKFNEEGTVVKLGPTDLEMLKTAEKMLLDEISLSLDIPRESMLEEFKRLINEL